MVQLLFGLLTLIAVSSSSNAEDLKKVPVRLTPDAGLQFKLPYTLGTHEGKVQELNDGWVIFDSTGTRIHEIHISFQVRQLKTGNAELECHLREAIELDYRESQFPKSQVCKDNELPQSGPNSSRYPLIEFHARPDLLIPLSASNSPSVLEFSGTLSIHGKSQQRKILLKVERKTSEGFIPVSGQFQVNLADHGIQVKPFLFIKVKDTATVFFDLQVQAP